MNKNLSKGNSRSPKKKVTVMLDKEAAQKLKSLSEKEKSSLSKYINDILREFVENL